MEASAQVRFIQNGGREFLTDEPISLHTYEEEKIDIHHIFPQKWQPWRLAGIPPTWVSPPARLR